MMKPSLIALALVLVASLETATAFRHGDLVPMLSRASFGNLVSELHDVPPSTAPRFGVNKMVTLYPYPSDWDDLTEMKLQFQFANGAFMTRFLPLRTKYDYVDEVKLTFITHGGEITEIKVEAESHKPPRVRQRAWMSGQTPDDIEVKWPTWVMVKYHWDEAPDVNAGTGLTVLLTSTAGMVGIMWLYIAFDAQRTWYNAATGSFKIPDAVTTTLDHSGGIYTTPVKSPQPSSSSSSSLPTTSPPTTSSSFMPSFLSGGSGTPAKRD